MWGLCWNPSWPQPWAANRTKGPRRLRTPWQSRTHELECIRMCFHEQLESKVLPKEHRTPRENACHSQWQPHRLFCVFRISSAGRRVFRDFLNHLLNFRSIRGWRNFSLWQRPSRRIVVVRFSSFNRCCRFLAVGKRNLKLPLLLPGDCGTQA